MQNSALDTTTSIVGDGLNGLRTTVTALTFGGLTGANDLSTVFTTDAGGYGNVTALTLKPLSAVTNTYSGVISDGVAGMTLTKSGLGTQVLAGANTFTGATTVSGGTLVLDYNTQDNSKLSNTAPLTLNGVTLNLDGGTHTEVVSSTTVNTGYSQINRTSGTAKLALGGITPGVGSLVNFSASNIATTTTTNNASGILGINATVGGTDWAANDGSNNIVAYTGYSDISARGPSTIANAPLSNVRILADGTTGSIELGSATTTINSLLMSNANFAATVNTTGKTLVTPAIMLGSGKQSLNIGVAAGDGTLRTSVAGGDLTLINYDGTNNLTVNAAIANNTTASSVSVLGTGTVALAGPNTYTGPTTVYGGTLSLSGSLTGTAISTVGTAVLNQTGTGVIAGSSTVTQSSAATSTLAGANTYTGATDVVTGALNIQNNAALGSAVVGTTVSSGAALELQGGITVATEALTLNGTGVSDGGALRSVSGTNTYTGPITLASNARINSDAGLLTINNAGPINGAFELTIGGAGDSVVSSPIAPNISAFYKDGACTLTLTGPYTSTGLTTIAGGTLKVGAAGIFTNINSLSMPGTATLDANGFNIGFDTGLSGVATAVMTDNSAGAGTTKFLFTRTSNSSSLLMKDGPSKTIAVEFTSDGGSNVNGFSFRNGGNTYSGGTTLLNNPMEIPPCL